MRSEATGAGAHNDCTTSAYAAGPGLPSGRAASKDVSALRFELLRSAFYHDRLSRMLALAHRLSMFATVLLGSGAAVSFVADYEWLGPALALCVTLVSGSQLVWDLSGRAAEHKALRNQFYSLLADLEAGAGETEITGRMTALYPSEPPIINRVNKAAHNQAALLVYGDDFTPA